MKFELLIRNATVIDGTRAPRFEADIGISSGRISSIGKLKEKGEIELDASGQIAAPGFIDAHTHDDRLLLSGPDMAPKASQGVTTVITGNCGISLPYATASGGEVVAPLDLLDAGGGWFKYPTFAAYRETLESQPAAINAACLLGHTTLRVATMDRLDRAATRAEIARMREMAHEALASGAIG